MTSGLPLEKASAQEVFVGRDTEITWLRQQLANALDGAGSVVFVTGERGVGKSRLVGELLREVRNDPQPVTVGAGRCVEPQGPGEPFLPFLDIAGRLLLSAGKARTAELLRTYAPTAGVQLPAALLPDPDGRLRRLSLGANKERLIREAGDFIEAASRDFPVVLLLEDLHWADAPSVELLTHIGRRIPRQRVLIVGTLRQAETEARNAPLRRCALDLETQGVGHELRLGPFPRSAVEAYLETRFAPNAFPPELPERVHRRTEGLPLLVRSLIDVLVERGDLVRGAPGWRLARPLEALDLQPSEGLKALVRRQLETLPEPERELLRHAAVAGKELLTPIVASLVEGDELEVEEQLGRLCRVHGLLDPLGEEELPDGTLATRYRFAHELYQAVLYEDVGARRRLLLHQRVAEALQRHWADQAPRLAVEIAEHLEAARDFAAAIRFRTHAGNNAARRFAYAEAEEQYGWAVRLLERLPEPARLRPSLEIRGSLGAVLHAESRFDDAAAEYTAMLEEARVAGSAAGECAALAGLCDALFFARRVEEMAVRTHQALVAAARSESPSEVLAARGRVGQLLVCEGRLSEAVPVLDGVIGEARDRDERVALLSGLLYRSFVHYWQAAYVSAETGLVEARALATETGSGFWALAAWMFQGLARANQGRLSDALADFEEASAAARLNGDRFWLPRLVSHLGWVRREIFALPEAHEIDEAALALAREGPSPWSPEVEPLLNLCLDDAGQGRKDAALDRLGELGRLTDRDRWFRWMDELRYETVAAEASLLLGNLPEAATHAEALLHRARRLGARGYQCAAERLRAQVSLGAGSGIELAAERLELALEGLGDQPAPLEAWKAARALWLLYGRLGAEEAARRARGRASAEIDVIANGVRDPSLRDGFLAAPVIREVRDGAAGGRLVGMA